MIRDPEDEKLLQACYKKIEALERDHAKMKKFIIELDLSYCPHPQIREAGTRDWCGYCTQWISDFSNPAHEILIGLEVE